MQSVNSGSEIAVGIFAGPVRGLKYRSPSLCGTTNERGEFSYRIGEAVTFYVGGLVIGSVAGAPRVNLAQLVPIVDGKIDRLHIPVVTNLARLVLTLDRTGEIEGGVTIAPAVQDLVGPGFINFNQPEDKFVADPAVVSLLENLNAAPDAFAANRPRQLCHGATARNELRRNMRGIVKMTDVRVPMRDGTYVCADVFRPAEDGNYPVIMAKGFYGKAFYHECICNDEEALEKEVLEDRYFSGNPDGLQYENHESVDTAVWVPKGYICIRVDARGVCNSPGEQAPFSRQEAEDYYDAIEWAGTQPWSNGNVGLWGMSYLAMSQHNVASLQPSHLKAMVAQGTDADIYNEALYGGGIFGEGFWTWWHKAWSGGNFCGERRETDWMDRVLATPFNDPEAYGPTGSIFMAPEMDKATAPVWIVGPQAGAVIHQLGSSETFIRSTAAKARRFDFTDAWFPASYSQASIADHERWFDYWLKGIDNGVTDEAPVRIQLRTGDGGYRLVEEQEWPVARTEYRRWYLDATKSDWQGDGRRTDLMRIAQDVPTAEASASYDAAVELGQPMLSPMGPVGGPPRWSTGISFVSEPMAEDMALIGYMKAGLWVSSTASDMDVFVSLRVLDEDGREVRFDAPIHPSHPLFAAPVGHGLLKVSHRKVDSARSTEYWPVHTHAEADHAPLAPGEIAEIELGLNPSTAMIRKGCRLRVDIQPYAPDGAPTRAYDESYHTGAVNTVHTGPAHPCFIQLPIVPLAPQS
ncbi:CocE/NonD family hydrolase [Novosphingobium sp.]|uniref:CocE/NonD family hydrolase n=1 Tax=Novosphingobium sp. TaxID=1874826 RepID=UPI00286E96DB|nr:CocE/NonD family hydrolase [Novosphingobium sp.]